MSGKAFDIRSLNKYFSAQASHDLNAFLEKLPQNAGNSALIAGGIAWAAVAALGLFAMIQTQQVTKLRADLATAEALRPVVPQINMIPVQEDQVKSFVEKAKLLYPGLNLSSQGNTITIQSHDTSAYAQYREAVGYALNGGAGWKVAIKSMCVGRECPQNAIDVSLQVNKISIEKPVPAEPASENSETPATGSKTEQQAS